MVAYQEFVSLSQSMDSEERGSAAHLSDLAYLNHTALPMSARPSMRP